MKSTIYIEGGGDSKDLRVRCRQGFRKLLEKCGFQGKMPKLVACGGRNSTFDMFVTEFSNKQSDEFVALLIDSEDPVNDIETPWNHLECRDGWTRPDGADEQTALMMTTCMETWIVCDRAVLREHYGSRLQENALPDVSKMEGRDRDSVQIALAHATRNCKNRYSKGKRSFEILQKITPDTIRPHLPSFERMGKILNEKL